MALNLTRWTQLESSDITSYIEVVGSSGCEQILATLSGESDIATILIPGWKACANRLSLTLIIRKSEDPEAEEMEEISGGCKLTRRKKRIGDVSKDRLVSALINHIHCQSVTSLHQGIQILATRVHLNPTRVITRMRSLKTIEQSQLTSLSILFVCPDFVGLEIGGVEVGLGRIKDHAVNASVGIILVVLDILIKGTILGDGEDVSIAGVLVEWVTVDIVWGLVGGQNEDGAGVGVGASSQG